MLTSYSPVDPDKIKIIGDTKEINQFIEQTGFFDFGELHFELYEGKGGHLAGESVLIDFEHHIAFTGDIFVNMKDMTKPENKENPPKPEKPKVEEGMDVD